MAKQEIVLGGGCFWCLEAVYQEVKGVEQVENGYAGGHVPNPSYEAICTGTSGHAEVVRVVYDTDVISCRDILEIFFTIHDPTTRNRQGNDIGPQYRSVIFFNTEHQEEIAKLVIAAMANVWDAPIVTQLLPNNVYYKAEAHHQNYFRQHPNQGYCAMVVAPKVVKLRKLFSGRLKST
jgi:peptide-methionine (S)-S-oxide reductase